MVNNKTNNLLKFIYRTLYSTLNLQVLPGDQEIDILMLEIGFIQNSL